jgi:LPXTG-motif cell wall-anchored protein
MKKRIMTIGTVLALGMLLSISTSMLRAEDSGVFKNAGDITRAQEILVRDGYLSADSFTSGKLDAATRGAISNYQSEHAMNDRGDLDDETFQSLTSHEMTYPWGIQEAENRVEPQPVEPAPAPKVVRAPPVPEPTPASVQVREAPPVPQAPTVPPAPVVAAQPGRKMPATGRELPVMFLSGLLLLGAGAFLLRRCFA